MFAYHRPQSGHVVGRSEIGFFGKWIEARMDEHSAYRGMSQNLWEFEHGWRQGYDAAMTALGD